MASMAELDGDGQKLVQHSSQRDVRNGSGNIHPNNFRQSTLRTPLSPWLGSLHIPSPGLVSDGEPHCLDERPTLPARSHELQYDITDTVNGLPRSLHPQDLHIPSPHATRQQALPHQHRGHWLSFFNIYNTYLQIRWISHYGNYTTGWLGSPKFRVGLLVFITGMIINMWADSVLLCLRRGNEGYKIPRGGLFEYVSCPNYWGEMVEWLGWAVMTWSFAGLSFFLYTAANLGPRAAAHHDWYHK